MDLTPPPSLSPASPPNSYCPSETEPFDYPSPIIVSQSYRLSPLYVNQDPTCSMIPVLGQEISLPALGSMNQHPWNQSSGGHVPASQASLSAASTAEYDAYNSYVPHLPSSYGHSFYPTPTLQSQKAPSLVRTPSPGFPPPRVPILPSSGSPLLFPPLMSLPTHSTPLRSRMETAVPDGTDAPSYILPSPAGPSYPVQPSSMYGGDSQSNISTGYLSDSSPGVWGQSAPGSAPSPLPSPFFSASGCNSSDQQQPLTGLASDQQPRSSSRTRRQPRRLTTKEEANFQCQIEGCGKLFSRSYNYKAHMETHDEKREYPFPCQVPDCDKKFVRKTDLQRHHQSVHAKERNHKCDYCGRLFARKDTLRRHMDDGCSKRFDIGTLDLRTEGYGNMGGSSQNDLWRAR